MQEIINEQEVRKAINIMKPDGQLFEVRAVYESGQIYSGYFCDADSLIEALDRDIRDYAKCNFYITLNDLNKACFDRTQKNRFEKRAKASTSDNDVVGYDWLMIDLDPKRPTGTSSTDEQVEMAKKRGNKIFAFMRDLGFNPPLTGFSGNGIHLLYKLCLNSNDETKKLMETALKTLAMMFSDEEIEVDVKNFNPSRVCKLYGTRAQKGSDSDERPHRMSYIIGNPQNVSVTDIQYLRKLCDLYPKEEKPQRYNRYQPREFDLDSWLTKYGLHYRTSGYADGTKYILDCCPFDSNHKGKDACIFKSQNGAIGFHCFHNSCADKTWRDVRLLFEPDAYEKKEREYERQIYSDYNRKPKEPPKIEVQDGKPVFYTAMDIFNLPTPAETFIRSGIQMIDQKLRGLKKGYVSVLSGLRAAGKSSVISEMVLDAVQAGFNVGVFSGELAPKNFMRWMNLQAAGKGYTDPTQFENYYNVRDEYQRVIAKWLDRRFWLYNNEYGNDFIAILKEFEKKIDNDKLDFLILDNLMAFNISNLSRDKFDAQSAFVLELTKLAKAKNIHIMFVAHPRKSAGFLRLQDISGTADLGNAVDNAFIIHRVNKDFKKLSKEEFGWKDDYYLYQATNVIEIAKDRDGGTQDIFVPLYYEAETKRLKNSPAENKIYGWHNYDKGEFEPVKADWEIPY